MEIVAESRSANRGLRGPNSVRDAATISYLNEWLLRPRRDPYVDLRGMTRRAGRIAPARRFLLWIASAQTFYGSAARSCSSVAAAAESKARASITRCLTGWADSTACSSNRQA